MKNSFRNEKLELDAIDSKILEHLDKHARISIAEIAREVSMSSPSINERIKRMEEHGIITRYTVELDSESLGYPLVAIVRMRQHPGKIKELIAMIQSIPEIIECDKVTGEDCFITRICFESMSQLDTILDKLSGLSETNTSIVKATVVERRNVPYHFRRSQR